MNNPDELMDYFYPMILWTILMNVLAYYNGLVIEAENMESKHQHLPWSHGRLAQIQKSFSCWMETWLSIAEQWRGWVSSSDRVHTLDTVFLPKLNTLLSNINVFCKVLWITWLLQQRASQEVLHSLRFSPTNTVYIIIFQETQFLQRHLATSSSGSWCLLRHFH